MYKNVLIPMQEEKLLKIEEQAGSERRVPQIIEKLQIMDWKSAAECFISFKALKRLFRKESVKNTNLSGPQNPAVRFDIVGPLDIAEFKRYMLNRNQKPATINRVLASLSTFFTWAVEQGHAAQNPVSGVKPVRETRAAPRALGRREQLALMRAVQKSGRVRDIPLVTLPARAASGVRYRSTLRREKR